MKQIITIIDSKEEGKYKKEEKNIYISHFNILFHDAIKFHFNVRA